MSRDDLTRLIVSRTSMLGAVALLVYFGYLIYRLDTRRVYGETELFFWDNRKELYKYVHNIENGTIKQLPNGGYPSCSISRSDDLLVSWTFSQNGFIGIADHYALPNDGVYYLIYCPQGSATFDLQKATGEAKAMKIKTLDDHWVHVVKTYGEGL